MKKNILPFDFNEDDTYLLVYQRNKHYEHIILRKEENERNLMR